MKPQFHWVSPSGDAASIAGRCARSERGLTGQHGHRRGLPGCDQSGFVIFDVYLLTSVRAERRPLANRALFFLQNGVIVCDGTLLIHPWHPNALLYTRFRRPAMCSQTAYYASVTTVILHRPHGIILHQGVAGGGRAAAAERGYHQGYHVADVRAAQRAKPISCPAFCRAFRRLTAVCCLLPILTQCDSGSGASTVFAAAHRRSTTSKSSRACGAPTFVRLRRAPVASSAQQGI